MATVFTKLGDMPSNLEGSDLSRSEDKEIRIAGMMPVEIFHVAVDAGGAVASQDVQTGMNFVFDGYLFAITGSAAVAGALVKPSAGNPTIATVTGIPATATRNYLLVVTGEKNPNALS